MGGQERLGREVLHQTTLFYVDDGLVTSTDPLDVGSFQYPCWVVQQGRDSEIIQQDSLGALPPPLYGCYPVRGGLQVDDDWGETKITGSSAATGSVPWLWRGPGGGVTGGMPEDSTWCWHAHGSVISGKEPPPLQIIHRCIRCIYQARWDHFGLRRQGVKGEGGNEGRSPSAFPETSHKGQHSPPGGGQPPPSTVPPLWYSCAMGRPEQPPPQHHPVHQEGGFEMA